MNAVDRRTIHVLFENHNDIITQSEGEGDERHIVLMKRDDAK
jgi:predicted RNA-binding protein Jag